MSQPSGINKVMSGADWLMLITLSLLWGGSFLFNDIAVRELPTLTVVTVRVGLASPAWTWNCDIVLLRIRSGSSSRRGNSEKSRIAQCAAGVK